MGKFAMWAVALGLAVGALLTGCGSSDGTGSTEVGGLSWNQYAKRAESICRKAEDKKYEQIGAAYQLVSAGGKPVKLTRGKLEQLTLTVVVPRLREMAEGLRELPPPAERQKEVEDALTTFEGEIDRTENEPKLFIESESFDQMNRAMRNLKIEGCVINQ
jgi:hypothetical protein